MVDKWKKAPKRLSALLAAAILLACGCDSNKTKEGSTTELTSENMIESTTDKVVSTTQTFPEAVFPVVPETEGMEKSFQYTIFEEWLTPVSFSIPFDVNDYIFTSDGKECFKMDQRASDSGWKEQVGTRTDGNSEEECKYYYYDCGDMWVLFEINYQEGEYSDGIERNGFAFFYYDFIHPNDPNNSFFPRTPGVITEKSNAMFCASFNNAGQTFYELGKGSNCYAYYDQIVLLSYMFSFVSRYPSYNPLSFAEFDNLRNSHYSEDSDWVYYFQ